MGELRFRRWPIWRAIFLEAWQAALADVQIIKGWGLMVPILIFAIYLLLVWKLVGADAAGGELKDKILLTIAPLITLPLCYLVRLALVIPDREASLGNRVVRLRDRLTPRFEIAVIEHTFGNFEGKPGEAKFICLAVTNASEYQSDICVANLVEFRGDNGKSIVDAVELYWWGPTHHEQHWAQIPSRATKTVKVFRLWDHGVSFNMQVVPEPYSSMFEGGTKFIGKIAFDDRYFGGQMLHFVLDLSGAPALEIIQSEAFKVHHQADIEDENL